MYDTRNRRAKIQNLLCMILCISLLACPLRVSATDAGEGQAAEVSWPQGPAIRGRGCDGGVYRRRIVRAEYACSTLSGEHYQNYDSPFGC